MKWNHREIIFFLHDGEKGGIKRIHFKLNFQNEIYYNIDFWTNISYVKYKKNMWFYITGID